MKAWRVCGSDLGEVIYADDEASAAAQYEYGHGCPPKEVAPAPNLNGEPRENFTNAELQAAGFAVPCDRCLAEGAFDWRYDLPDEHMTVVNGETVCDQCITPREMLAVGGDVAEYTYADEHMDTPFGALPRQVVPLADMETA